MPSILVTHRLPASALQVLASAGDVDISHVDLDAAGFREAVKGRDALVSMLTNRVDAALLDAAGPSLKIVANVAVGYDNIDVAAARARGVVVTNTPDVLTGAVAEFTWGLILAITRRLSESERLVRRGAWKGWSFDFLPGTELSGKQLGVIGTGRIGRAVAAKAGAFGMRVAFGGRRAGTMVDDAPVQSIEQVLAQSDVVSLHVPLRPDTRHLINAGALALMKSTAYLINTARGPVVDEEALAAALASGRLAGAALDVFEREPVIHPALLPLENVLLVPHLGSATHETRAAMAGLAARNVAAVLGGLAPLTPV
jgi:glyoxylate reductase